MSIFRFALAGATACLLAAAMTFPAQAKCYGAKERDAVHVRTLQTTLMVAALSCRRVLGPEFPAQYNQFMRKHGKELTRQSYVLQAHFKREYGSGWMSRLDKFLTAMANDATRRSMGGGGFCAATRPVFEQLVASEPTQLASVSTDYVLANGGAVQGCEVKAAKNDAK